MTAGETQKTARIINDLKGRHTLDRGRTRHGLRARDRGAHHGAASRPRSSPRATSPRSRTIPRSRKPISGREASTDAHPVGRSTASTTAATSCTTSRWGSEDKQILTVLGRNGTGKTTLLKTLMGLTDKATGRIDLGGREHRRRRRPISTGPSRHRLCAAGPADHPGLHRTGEHSDGRLRAARMASRRSRISCRCLFPYLMANLGRPGGLLVGRPAATTRHRPGARGSNPRCFCSTSRPKVSSPISSSRDRGHHPEAQSRGRTDHRPGRTEHPLRPPSRRRCSSCMEKGRVAASGKRAARSADDLIHRHLAV